MANQLIFCIQSLLSIGIVNFGKSSYAANISHEKTLNPVGYIYKKTNFNPFVEKKVEFLEKVTIFGE